MVSRFFRRQPFSSSSRVAYAVTIIIMWLQSSHRLLVGKNSSKSTSCLVRAFQTSIQRPNHRFTQSRTWHDPIRRRRKATLLFRRSFGLQTSSNTDADKDGVTHLPLQKRFVFYIDTPDDMQDLGGLLATLMPMPPTALFLDGDLGAGKTALARGFLRTTTANPDLVVTSPTYLLSNVYRSAATNDAAAAAAAATVYHMDLYRLAQKDTTEQVRDLLRPLNLDHVFLHDVVLMEWPERLGPAFLQRHDNATEASFWPVLPPERLEIDIRIIQATTTTTMPQREDQEDNDDDNDNDNDNDNDGEMQDVQRRVVTLTPIGNQWRQAVQQAVEEGYVDDFLFPDDDDDDDE